MESFHSYRNTTILGTLKRRLFGLSETCSREGDETCFFCILDIFPEGYSFHLSQCGSFYRFSLCFWG
ncbi:hypothetical protein PMAYCL1PPCAC_22503, partial [Pristionchus mayeri]